MNFKQGDKVVVSYTPSRKSKQVIGIVQPLHDKAKYFLVKTKHYKMCFLNADVKAGIISVQKIS